MTPAGYVPDAGDIVWLDFDPQMGREQAGRRPALVVSAARYNGPAGLIVCCPITTRIKGYPFEVLIKGAPPSVILVDQIGSKDWRARKADRKGRASVAELAEVRAKLAALIS